MKDFIFYAIIGGLFALNIVSAYKERRANNFAYRYVLFSQHKDWIWAFLLLSAIIIPGTIIEPYVPGFLKWSLFSILGKDGTNANVEIIGQSAKISPAIVFFIVAVLMLILPKAAYWEETKFRHGITKMDRECVKKNIKFGLLHCLVGVPIWIGLLLAIVGLALSVRYIRVYRKTNSSLTALSSSTSLHGKYNVILVILMTLAVLYG